MIRSGLKSAFKGLLRRATGGGAAAPVPEDAVEAPPASIEVEADVALGWARDGALLIDVREPNELYGGHVAGALLIPMRQVEGRHAEIPRDRRVIVYCAAGARSASVVEHLRRAGYTDVWSLDGGFGAWSGAGGATARPPTSAAFGITSTVRLGARSGTVQGIAETPEGMRYTVQFVDAGRVEQVSDIAESRLERVK